MRRDSVDTKVALAGLTKDLESIKLLITAMTGILQENLVTISAHDKNSTDWRGILMSTAESAFAKIDAVERAIEANNRSHADWSVLQASIVKGLEDIARNGKLLRGVLGLEAFPNPLPLNRDLRETLELLRTQCGLDPATGKVSNSMDWWVLRFKESFAHGIVIAALALAYNVLAPYLPWRREGIQEAPSHHPVRMEEAGIGPSGPSGPP